jgi:WSC domain
MLDRDSYSCCKFGSCKYAMHGLPMCRRCKFLPASLLKADMLMLYQSTQHCGGPGGYLAMYYDSTKYDPISGAISIPAAPNNPNAIGPYSYVGCWTDSTGSRSLSVGTVGKSSNMSLEGCSTSCQGYKLFGTEYGQECYCGNGILSSATQKPDSDCNMACTGNSSEYCGNGNRLSLYFLNDTGSAIPVIPKSGSVESSIKYS